jgi:aspartate racemase
MTEMEMRPEVPVRTIGILGGMGPEATLDLFRDIIRLTPARRDQDHIPVIICSNPRIPDRTRAIEGTGESPVPAIVESARTLETGGAGIIAMPCNAAHHFLPEIQRQVSIPILDMIEETGLWLAHGSLVPKTVGLIASTGTVLSAMYPKTLLKRKIHVLVPDEGDQERIQIAIDQVKAGTHNRITQDTFQSIGLHLVESGAEAIILGCTEVPLAFDPDAVGYPTLNPTKILAEVAVKWALGKT